MPPPHDLTTRVALLEQGLNTMEKTLNDHIESQKEQHAENKATMDDSNRRITRMERIIYSGLGALGALELILKLALK